MTQTGHRIKWDHFDILATGQSDIHCKIKETLLIRDLKPALTVKMLAVTSSYKTVCKQILDVITNSSQVPGELSNPLSSGR